MANVRLDVTGLTVFRGTLRVVDGANLKVPERSIVGLLGLNGAGKSSLLASIAGDLPAESGSIMFDGVDVIRRPSWERCRSGLVLVPAGRQLFTSISVVDNLLVGGHLTSKQERKATLEIVYEFFPILRSKARQLAKDLSGGQQQMLAIGRGLMAQPSVLMLDEPSEGLSPLVVEQVFEAIQRLRDEQGMSILLAEQNAGAIDVIDSLMVMRSGVLSEARATKDTDKADVADYIFG